MARLSATFVLLSIALAARGIPAPDGHDTTSDSNDSKQQQAEKPALWGGADCVNSCRSKWGWTGHTFGDDPWGGVMFSGDPVPTSTSCSSSEESTSSSTEAAATVETFNPPTQSVPINIAPVVTSETSSETPSETFSETSSETSSETFFRDSFRDFYFNLLSNLFDFRIYLFRSRSPHLQRVTAYRVRLAVSS
jgi:hypothetical protein